MAAPAAPVSDPHVTLDLSVGVGGGDSTGDGEPLVGWGLHLTVRPVERLVLGASMEGATNWIGSIHGFLTGGVGLAKSLPAGRLVVMALGGIHGLDGAALGGLADHSMKTLGARASWEGSLGRWIFARGGLAASAYFDLERPYDAKVDGHVGGVTILVSVALGLGLGV
ncbi:MAG TPA: hypothetical protein VLT61_10915 [Anaeromyxobacteraceae bacterium]|nr:hypothetical protein [Anaeromyxobacteraceae bacterium]